MSPLRTATAIRLAPAVHEALRETADEMGVSMNWLVNQLCREGLERMEIPALTLVRAGGGTDALRDIVLASRDDGLAAMCNWMRGRAAAALKGGNA